jgi:hypothetical protein
MLWKSHPRVALGPAVLLEAVVGQAEERLTEGCSVADVTAELGANLNTLQKAIRARSARRLKRAADDGVGFGSEADRKVTAAASSKSERPEVDCGAPT